jgi:hypothetical protein
VESPAPYSLRFSYFDDALDAIDTWNENCASCLVPPVTLQIVVTPGFHSPYWVWTNIDTAAGGPGMGSCDPLFINPTKHPPTSLSGCGYTKIFYDTEDTSDQADAVHTYFPLPWNGAYKYEWQKFLTLLNKHIGSHPEFVSIAVAGPTASSAEMILPNGNGTTTTNANAGTLTLNRGGTTVSVYEAWNCLLGNNYGVSDRVRSKVMRSRCGFS